MDFIGFLIVAGLFFGLVAALIVFSPNKYNLNSLVFDRTEDGIIKIDNISSVPLNLDRIEDGKYILCSIGLAHKVNSKKDREIQFNLDGYKAFITLYPGKDNRALFRYNHHEKQMYWEYVKGEFKLFTYDSPKSTLRFLGLDN